MNSDRESPPLMFESPRYHGRELGADEVPRVQELFDANPEYFLAINGGPPRHDEAQIEFDSFPPDHLGFTKRWFAGLFDRQGEMIGVTMLVADLGAAQVWHIGLFLVATQLHGLGVADEIYAALEAWMHRSGARWLRLGVVDGNARAERFWSRRGFREVRTRADVDTGGRFNNIRVLVKPLEELTISEYLARVPRDKPESTLP